MLVVGKLFCERRHAKKSATRLSSTNMSVRSVPVAENCKRIRSGKATTTKLMQITKGSYYGDNDSCYFSTIQFNTINFLNLIFLIKIRLHLPT